MNQNLKTKILAAAFLVGGLTAGATEIAQRVAMADDPVYEWEGSGPENSGSYVGTIEGARIHYGCYEPSGTVCAQSTDVQNPVIIYKP